MLNKSQFEVLAPKCIYRCRNFAQLYLTLCVGKSSPTDQKQQDQALEIEIITVAGLTIGEPVTSLTDIVLAVISFTLFARIKNRLNESFFNNSWRMFFLFMGISTGTGALAHALNGTEAIWWYNTLFMAMTVFSSISVFFALKATIRFTNMDSGVRKFLTITNFVLLAVFMAYTFISNNFEIFKIHAAAGLFLIFLTHFIAWQRSHSGSGWIMSGMGISFFTVLIHTQQFSLSPWFNYKDISHVIMMVSLVMIYNGIHMMSENLKLSVFRTKLQNKAA